MKKVSHPPIPLLLFLMLIGCVSIAFSQPVITSFSPISAKPGDTVVLNGSNFNTTPANNIVFFGATRANITASTAINVTVTVPTGATYAPITILNTDNNLIASSLSNFTPTYSPQKTVITTTDFQAKQDFATGTTPYSVAIGDLDVDGKPDLVVANANSNTISIYRNISISGSFGSGSFAPKVDITTGANPISVAIGDLDGDGKPDLVAVHYNSYTVTIFRNTSLSGSIGTGSFAPKIEFTTETQPYSVAIKDLDGDGKPDLVVTHYSSNIVSVYRNTSMSGSISSGSFAPKVGFTTTDYSRSVAIGDLDGDGKPDLAIANQGSSTVSVLRNTSSIGNIGIGSFAAKVDFTTGTNPISVTIGDLDGDGKPDLAVASNSSSTVTVLRNTSTSGSIGTGSFATKVDFTTGLSPVSVAISDLNGDSKPDLVVANYISNTLSVLRNTSNDSSFGSVSFAPKVDFTTGSNPYSVAIGDLDGDGRPDLTVANRSSDIVSVLRNLDGIVMSIRSGAWNDPNTWNINRPPLASEAVIISQNHTVEITTLVNAKTIEYKNNSKLSFKNIASKLNIGF